MRYIETSKYYVLFDVDSCEECGGDTVAPNQVQLEKNAAGRRAVSRLMLVESLPAGGELVLDEDGICVGENCCYGQS